MPEHKNGNTKRKSDAASDDIVSEIVWTLKRSLILLKNWTMPITTATPTEIHDDGVSARAFALAVIVGLTFAVRGETLGSNRAAFTAIVGVLAASASYGLNAAVRNLNLQKKFNVKTRERWLISAYTSLIGVMLFFVVFQNFFTGQNWYGIFTDEFGKTLFPVALAFIATFMLLFVKARFLDRHQISSLAAVHAAIVIFCCSVLTFGISVLSNEGFNAILDWAAKK